MKYHLEKTLLHNHLIMNMVFFRYLNRLSDFLFTIARFAARIDIKEETIYSPPQITDPAQDNSYKPVIIGGSGIEGVWKKDSK